MKARNLGTKFYYYYYITFFSKKSKSLIIAFHEIKAPIPKIKNANASFF